MDYIRIINDETCEITEKKSRFIAYISYVTNEIYDPLTLKTQTNVTGMLEVVKPNE